jgi:hypothetical protein
MDAVIDGAEAQLSTKATSIRSTMLAASMGEKRTTTPYPSPLQERAAKQRSAASFVGRTILKTILCEPP